MIGHIYNLTWNNVYFNNIGNYGTILRYYGESDSHTDQGKHIIEMNNIEMYNVYDIRQFVFETHRLDDITATNIHLENITCINEYGAFWYLKTVWGNANVNNLTIKNTFVRNINIICWAYIWQDLYLNNTILDNVGTNGISVVWITYFVDNSRLVIDNFSIINSNNVTKNKMGILFDFQYYFEESWTFSIEGGCYLSNILIESNVFQKRLFNWNACQNTITLNYLNIINNRYLIGSEFDDEGSLISTIVLEQNYISLSNIYISDINITFAADYFDSSSYKSSLLLFVLNETKLEPDSFIHLDTIIIQRTRRRRRNKRICNFLCYPCTMSYC